MGLQMRWVGQVLLVRGEVFGRGCLLGRRPLRGCDPFGRGPGTAALGYELTAVGLALRCLRVILSLPHALLFVVAEHLPDTHGTLLQPGPTRWPRGGLPCITRLRSAPA